MYYTPWCFIDSAMCACGFGWDGKVDKEGNMVNNWNRVRACYNWDVEWTEQPLENIEIIQSLIGSSTMFNKDSLNQVKNQDSRLPS